MIQIKKVGSESIDIIRLLAHYIWQTAYKDILSPQQMSYMLELTYSNASLQKQIEELQHQFVIVYDDEKPVGFASYCIKNREVPGIYRLHKIYIDPHIQGKGIGKTLLDHILTEIKPSGATDLELNVNRYNKALHFYQKVGFTISGEEDIDIGNGYFMNDYVMNLKV